MGYYFLFVGYFVVTQMCISSSSDLVIINVIVLHCFKRVVSLSLNSIATLPNEGGGFVSVGEDRTLRIWKGQLCVRK